MLYNPRQTNRNSALDRSEVFIMKKPFGVRSDGIQTYVYTITGGGLTAQICDHGATITRLWVPDKEGNLADVILGFDTPDEYTASDTHTGAVVGRSCNRTRNGRFTLEGKTYQLDLNDGNHSLHGGFDPYKNRMWQVVRVETNAITLELHSPDGDQGFPGNATIRVTYTLEAPATLRVTYDAICDKDTVFNLTNHSLFNMAGHDKPEKAMGQILILPARHFTVSDGEYIPTGEVRSVEGTPMDFRAPKPIGRDINADYECIRLQAGYDHNFEIFTDPGAILTDPESGRTMAITTDCPGVHFYAGNFLNDVPGKDGVVYTHRGGVALETQFYPDAVNHPEWASPVVKAGVPYHSETKYKFS